MTLGRDTPVLVTGAGGFLGGRFVERLVLEKQAQVRVLLRSMGRASRIASLPVQYHLGDVTDHAAFAAAAKSCEVVFHCASNIEPGVPPNRTSTCVGAQMAARVCAESGARLVHISSCAVYGLPTTPEVDETAPHRARHRRDRYALAKIAAERFLRSYASENGLQAVILQPTMIYGPHSGEWTTTPLAMLGSANVAMPAFDSSVCNAVYVDDVISAAFLAVEKCDTTCPSYLINGDDLPTWSAFLSRHAALGTRGAVVPVGAQELDRLKSEAGKGHSLLRTMLRLLRERPEVRSAIMSTSLARGAFALLEKCSSRKTFEIIKARLSGRSVQGAALIEFPHREKLTLRPPPPHFLDLARQSHRYSSAKARRELGYAPAFSLDAAFEWIAAWARWSRLVS